MGIANEMWKRKVILSSDYAVFTELDEIEYWDRISEDYEHNIIKYSTYPGRILDSILHDLSESNTVLDVGAGPGTFAIPLATKVKLVTAIEPSVKMYHLLKHKSEQLKLNNIEWLNSTIQNAKIIPHDISITAHSLYYIVDLSSAIQKICSVTKKRMYIVHGVNNDTLFHELVWEITNEEPYIPGPNYRLLCDVLQELDMEYKISFFNMIHELRFPSIESLFNNFLISKGTNNRKSLEDNLSKFIKKKENYYYLRYNFDNVLICISKESI